MQAQWSPRKPIGRTPNVILAKSCAHQEAARRSIKNSTISDSIVRGRALRKKEPVDLGSCDRFGDPVNCCSANIELFCGLSGRHSSFDESLPAEAVSPASGGCRVFWLPRCRHGFARISVVVRTRLFSLRVIQRTNHAMTPTAGAVRGCARRDVFSGRAWPAAGAAAHRGMRWPCRGSDCSGVGSIRAWTGVAACRFAGRGFGPDWRATGAVVRLGPTLTS